jgi:diguanylate cyclase (GGDEF)-like protein
VSVEAGQASVPFLLGLIVTAGVLVPMLLRMRAAVAEARAEGEEQSPQLESLRRANAKLQEDIGFLTHFLKDFPRLARELYNNLGERQVPGVLLNTVQRSLDPQQVAVLVRREETTRSDKRRKSPRFVVVAAYPENGPVPLGTEVPVDSGEIGFAAQSQIVATREDLEAEETRSRLKPGPALSGMRQPDLIAPLVFDRETLGAIVVARPRKSGDPKAALRLVAQSGAQVLHTAAQMTRIKHTAEMDGLTRVYNKNHMEQTLNELVYRAACAAYDQRDGGRKGVQNALSVFLFDIDNFKNYNDANGHLTGDNLLLELASLVQRSIRKEDIFGRFGGEEFLLILPHTDGGQAMIVAEKIRKLIASHPFPFAERQPLGRLSISGGVAVYPDDGLDGAAMLHRADEALYLAKKQGRNRVRPVSSIPAVTPAQEAASA